MLLHGAQFESIIRTFFWILKNWLISHGNIDMITTNTSHKIWRQTKHVNVL